MKKITIILVSLFLIVLILAAITINNSNIQEVRAENGDIPVRGYAWSDNIGWIQFDPAFGGVFVNKETKEFNGYAWSDNIGWISFEKDKIGNDCRPLVEDCKAWVDNELILGKNLIRGWARACSVFENPTECSGNLNSNRGGWNGWLSFSCYDFSCGVSNYGVEMDENGYLHGWAWGGGNPANVGTVGWVSFNCENEDECGVSDYSVQIQGLFSNVEISNLRIIGGSEIYCNFADENNAAVKFEWDYQGDNPQAKVSLRINGYSKDFESGSTSTIIGPPNELWLDYNTSYNISLSVEDTEGNQSNVLEDNFITDLHHYPIVKFSWSPDKNIFPGTLVDFYSETTFYTTGNSFWKFDPDGNPSSSNSEEETVQFLTTGNKLVTLTATDSVGSCLLSKTFSVGRKPPGWIEITP
ncbi:MAG: hypothetical protein PHN37_02950 [Candidatus Pacebacteria bacterium]|nr:hypothetical protein [Candidatus Paceibacterota bacterium]